MTGAVTSSGREVARDEREAMVARWYELTRRTLPAMAAEQRWPIRADHCFMRVCLDAACGAPWTRVVEAPAVRHASLRQLADAIATAEAIVARPDLLRGFNARSLAGRKRWREEQEAF